MSRSLLLVCLLATLALSGASARSLQRAQREGERRPEERRPEERRPEERRPEERRPEEVRNNGVRVNNNNVGNRVNPAVNNRVNPVVVGNRVNPVIGNRLGVVPVGVPGWGGPANVVPAVNNVNIIPAAGWVGGNPCACTNACVQGFSRCSGSGAGACTPQGGTACGSAFVDAIGVVRMCCSLSG